MTTKLKTTEETNKKIISKNFDVAKKSLVEKYRVHKSDTGSVEVQVALYSERMNDLVKHLKKHKKDHDSRRGLLMLIGKRRRLLNYLKTNNSRKYDKLIKDLGLRK